MTLFVVASPIGNLSDLSERAAATLRECSLVAAEDTRRTGRLLSHLGLKKPLVAFYDAVEAERTGPLLQALARGERIALISDAGTPAVSDPGYRLIRAALDAGHAVVPIPGPSAVLAALVVSGLPTDRFRFEGFVPRKAGAREALFDTLTEETATTVLFESPKRVLKTLDELAGRFPARPVALARELTKLHEEVLRGTAQEVALVLRAREAIKGEITLIVGGQIGVAEVETREVTRHARLLSDEGLPPGSVRRLLVKLLGVSREVAYRATTTTTEE